MLPIHTPAPEFELLDQNGTPHRLSDYRGRRGILYFYPKDMTSRMSRNVRTSFRSSLMDSGWTATRARAKRAR